MIQYEVIGENNVAVPTHLFKCFLGENKNSKKGVACFLMQNEPILEDKPLTDFQVPVEEVEKITGLRIFPEAFSRAVSKERSVVIFGR